MLKINDDARPRDHVPHARQGRDPGRARPSSSTSRYPDATFPSKIASGAGSIVDHERVPRRRPAQGRRGRRLRPLQAGLLRRGRGRLLRQRRTTRAPPKSRTPASPSSSSTATRQALKKALAGRRRRRRLPRPRRRATSPTSRPTPRRRQGIDVVEGTSAEVQHLVFNMNDPVAGKLGVRKAIAYLLDRDALVEDVYQGTADPAVLDHPGRHHRPQHGLLRHLRRPPLPGQGRGRAARRRHHRQGQADPLVAPRPATAPPPTQELKAIAKQLNASGLFDADVQVRRLRPVREGHRRRQVRRLREGLGARLPGPRQLHRPLLRQGQRPGQQLHQRHHHRRHSSRRPPPRATAPPPTTTTPSSRTSSPTTSRSSRSGRPSSTPSPATTSTAWSTAWTPRPSSASGRSARADADDGRHTPRAPSSRKGRPRRRHAICRPPTARRGAPARSRTRTPRPAPGRAAPAWSAHDPHAS